MQKYAPIAKSAGDQEIIDWTLRLRKSLKSIFTSASLLLESEVALINDLYGSYYFSCYYSMYHGMMAVLALDPYLTFNDVCHVHHVKALNHFVNNYCPKKLNVAPHATGERVEILRALREYYSYSMPLNEFFHQHEELSVPRYFMEYTVRNCFQIASLHSFLVEKSFRKQKKGHAKAIGMNYSHLIKSFHAINGKTNPVKPGEILIDPADRNTLREFLETGCEIIHHTLDLDHWFDEFRMYSSGFPYKPEGPRLSESGVYSFVYDSIM